MEGRIASSPLPSFYTEEVLRAYFIAITVATPAARVSINESTDGRIFIGPATHRFHHPARPRSIFALEKA